MVYEEVAALVDESGSEDVVNSSQRKRRAAAVALVGGVTLLVAIAAFAHGSNAVSSQHMEDTTEEFASVDIDKTQPSWQIVGVERD